jgi:hypothetical protein
MVIAFLSLVLLSSAFSALVGGAAGRWTAAFALLTTAMGFAVGLIHPSFARVEPLRVGVDVIFLVSLLWLTVAYRRWWLIWMAAFQANGTASHFAAMLSPTHVGVVYYWLSTAWGLPILLVWIFGLCKDRGWRIRPIAYVTVLICDLVRLATGRRR